MLLRNALGFEISITKGASSYNILLLLRMPVCAWYRWLGLRPRQLPRNRNLEPIISLFNRANANMADSQSASKTSQMKARLARLWFLCFDIASPENFRLVVDLFCFISLYLPVAVLDQCNSLRQRKRAHERLENSSLFSTLRIEDLR